MNHGFKYTLLMSSLPRHPKDLLSATLPPISRIQLDKRLVLLDAQDSAELKRIEQIIFWSHARDASSADIVAQDNAALATLQNHVLKELVLWRLSVRTLMSALRLRHAGAEPPAPKTFIGFSPWLRSIEQHWTHPTFAISPLAVPWLAQADAYLRQQQPLELETLLLDMSWRYYAKLGDYHTFDFEAVALYVLQWDVINRWSHYNRDYFKDTALANFNKLVDSALAGCDTRIALNTPSTP